MRKVIGSSPLGVLAALLAVLALVALSGRPVAGRPFQSPEWLKGDAEIRGSMVRDLDDSGLLIGMAREEVLALLGPPNAAHGATFVYQVDVGYRFGGSAWLYDFIVVFDPASRVATTDLRD